MIQKGFVENSGYALKNATTAARLSIAVLVSLCEQPVLGESLYEKPTHAGASKYRALDMLFTL